MEGVSGTDTSTRPALKRSLSLFQATLYGLGVTIGAGIYVLIGAAAARAGVHAPIVFLLAAIIMGFSAASFAELGGRLPLARMAKILERGKNLYFTGRSSLPERRVGATGSKAAFASISQSHRAESEFRD